MKRPLSDPAMWALTVGMAAIPLGASAQAPTALPSPLSLADVVRIATERRDEIQAARARTRAGETRPAGSGMPGRMPGSFLGTMSGDDMTFTMDMPTSSMTSRGVRREPRARRT